jgi:hypothetical protein
MLQIRASTETINLASAELQPLSDQYDRAKGACLLGMR